MVLFKLDSSIIISNLTPEFTFHYGSIQIDWTCIWIRESYRFTFHYGSIQIKINKSTNQPIADLHSTMVLFKWDITFELTNAVLFTFHYGSIQICFQYHSSNNAMIYIPLWFYSNGANKNGTPVTEAFTFHYGSIQMSW